MLDRMNGFRQAIASALMAELRLRRDGWMLKEQLRWWARDHDLTLDRVNWTFEKLAEAGAVRFEVWAGYITAVATATGLHMFPAAGGAAEGGRR